MQLLIDSTQETPDSLRFAAGVLFQLADLMKPVELTAEAPSINGPSAPIVLHAHGPAAPIDPQPTVTTEPAQMNPAEVFGRGLAALLSVPAGTNFPPPAATSTPTAPPAPAVSQESAPPAPMTTPTTALPATIAPAAVNDTPTPPAPSTGPAVTADAVSADRDSEGLPWDERVHSETRKRNTDGTWRYRRNLDPNVKATVVAELKAKYGNQSALTAPQAPLPPAAIVIVPDGSSGTLVTAPAPPVAPPPPAATVAPQPPVAPAPPSAAVSVPDGVSLGVPNAPQPPVLQTNLGFRDFMSLVSKARAAGRITEDQLNIACKAVNVDGITALASEPGRIGLVHAQIAHLLTGAAA